MIRRWLNVILITCITLCLALVVVIALNWYRLLYLPMPIGKEASTIIQIDKFTSASAFAHILKERNFIKSTRPFLLFIRLHGLSQQLKAGVYQILEGESAAQFLRRVAAGDVLIASFRIIEGTTQAQVAANLAKAPYLTYQAADWASITGSYPNAEGLLLADTYHYDAGSKSKDLLERAHKNLETFLASNWRQRSPGLPYKTPYELLIAASILEKETAIPQERRLIAGVIVNRLRKNMLLQMDPTVIYALGSRYSGKLTHEDLRIDSPYNSYRYRGLPPTPISMVGKDAIDAAAHPEPTDYLYFVARGDGSHYFSVNYEQQKQAITRYLKK